MKKQLLSLSINLGLFISGLFTAFSGLLLQIAYHIHNHGVETVNEYVLGMSYYRWSDVHKIAIVILSICMIFHIELHWKWYVGLIRKRLFAKNRQVLSLSVIFIFVAISGFIPWIIDLMEGGESIHKTFIEIHDKLAILLTVYLIMHVAKRLKWFGTTFEKIKKNTVRRCLKHSGAKWLFYLSI